MLSVLQESIPLGLRKDSGVQVKFGQRINLSCPFHVQRKKEILFFSLDNISPFLTQSPFIHSEPAVSSTKTWL